MKIILKKVSTYTFISLFITQFCLVEVLHASFREEDAFVTYRSPDALHIFIDPSETMGGTEKQLRVRIGTGLSNEKEGASEEKPSFNLVDEFLVEGNTSTSSQSSSSATLRDVLRMNLNGLELTLNQEGQLNLRGQEADSLKKVFIYSSLFLRLEGVRASFLGIDALMVDSRGSTHIDMLDMRVRGERRRPTDELTPFHNKGVLKIGEGLGIDLRNSGEASLDKGQTQIATYLRPDHALRMRIKNELEATLVLKNGEYDARGDYGLVNEGTLVQENSFLAWTPATLWKSSGPTHTPQKINRGKWITRNPTVLTLPLAEDMGEMKIGGILRVDASTSEAIEVLDGLIQVEADSLELTAQTLHAPESRTYSWPVRLNILETIDLQANLMAPSWEICAKKYVLTDECSRRFLETKKTRSLPELPSELWSEILGFFNMEEQYGSVRQWGLWRLSRSICKALENSYLEQCVIPFSHILEAPSHNQLVLPSTKISRVTITPRYEEGNVRPYSLYQIRKIADMVKQQQHLQSLVIKAAVFTSSWIDGMIELLTALKVRNPSLNYVGLPHNADMLSAMDAIKLSQGLDPFEEYISYALSDFLKITDYLPQTKKWSFPQSLKKYLLGRDFFGCDALLTRLNQELIENPELQFNPWFHYLRGTTISVAIKTYHKEAVEQDVPIEQFKKAIDEYYEVASKDLEMAPTSANVGVEKAELYFSRALAYSYLYRKTSQENPNKQTYFAITQLFFQKLIDENLLYFLTSKEQAFVYSKLSIKHFVEEDYENTIKYTNNIIRSPHLLSTFTNQEKAIIYFRKVLACRSLYMSAPIDSSKHQYYQTELHETYERLINEGLIGFLRANDQVSVYFNLASHYHRSKKHYEALGLSDHIIKHPDLFETISPKQKAEMYFVKGQSCNNIRLSFQDNHPSQQTYLEEMHNAFIRIVEEDITHLLSQECQFTVYLQLALKFNEDKNYAQALICIDKIINQETILSALKPIEKAEVYCHKIAAHAGISEAALQDDLRIQHFSESAYYAQKMIDENLIAFLNSDRQTGIYFILFGFNFSESNYQKALDYGDLIFKNENFWTNLSNERKARSYFIKIISHENVYKSIVEKNPEKENHLTAAIQIYQTLIEEGLIDFLDAKEKVSVFNTAALFKHEIEDHEGSIKCADQIINRPLLLEKTSPRQKAMLYFLKSQSFVKMALHVSSEHSLHETYLLEGLNYAQRIIDERLIEFISLNSTTAAIYDGASSYQFHKKNYQKALEYIDFILDQEDLVKERTLQQKAGLYYRKIKILLILHQENPLESSKQAYYELAIQWCQKIINENLLDGINADSQARLYQEMAAYYFNKKHYQEAVEYFDNIINQPLLIETVTEKRKADLYFARIVAYQNIHTEGFRDHITERNKFYEKLIEENLVNFLEATTQAEIYYNLCSYYLNVGKYEEALKYINQALTQAHLLAFLTPQQQSNLYMGKIEACFELSKNFALVDLNHKAYLSEAFQCCEKMIDENLIRFLDPRRQIFVYSEAFKNNASNKMYLKALEHINQILKQENLLRSLTVAEKALSYFRKVLVCNLILIDASLEDAMYQKCSNDIFENCQIIINENLVQWLTPVTQATVYNFASIYYHNNEKYQKSLDYISQVTDHPILLETQTTQQIADLYFRKVQAYANIYDGTAFFNPRRQLYLSELRSCCQKLVDENLVSLLKPDNQKAVYDIIARQ